MSEFLRRVRPDYDPLFFFFVLFLANILTSIPYKCQFIRVHCASDVRFFFISFNVFILFFIVITSLPAPFSAHKIKTVYFIYGWKDILCIV
jgi:hypothetical protein